MSVAIVGAGPGDPGLMTARSLELIAHADVILHDRLIPAQALAGARADAQIIDVGKQGHGESVGQDQIERLLLEHGGAGKRVVRLKGGDPLVFGRGAEEALVLRRAGIPFEIVPGVTAGIAAAAYAGISVTHREYASAVTLITAHEDPAKEQTALDWEALGRFRGTLVFYMGVRRLAATTARLIQAGRSSEEPAAVVQRGTLPDQRTVIGTLATIAELAADVQAPAVTIVGDVVSLADELAWFSRGPLAGRTIGVTRARVQSSELARRLRELGATVVEAPTIATRRLDVELPDFREFDLVCLTSPSGVDHLFESLRDARDLAGPRIAAIGPGTAAALARHGIVADVVPEQSTAEGLLDVVGDVKRVLIARAAKGREVLPEGLRARGVDVELLALYETVAQELTPVQREGLERADAIAFASSSAVESLLSQITPAAKAISIGPATSATLREHGIEPDREAERHDIEGLIEALLA